MQTISSTARIAMVLLGTMIVSSVSASKELGMCPDVASNVFPPSLNASHFSGLWYEYLVTPGVKEGKNYDCATWLWLKDSPEEPQFTVIYNSAKVGANDSSVSEFHMDCDLLKYPSNTAVCYYQQDRPSNYLASLTTQKERAFKIISTDYFSYMVVLVCQNYGLFHYLDYVVLTREKEPSRFHRLRIKETVEKYGLTAKDFVKGKVFQCWGED
jgi:hypothetical protein